MLESVRYNSEKGTLEVLDQLLLPTQEQYQAVRTTQDAWDVIRTMKVRGAPLIAIVAMLGVAVEAKKAVQDRDPACSSAGGARDWLVTRLDHLRTSRPTAVNLFTACDEMAALAEVEGSAAGSTGSTVLEAFIKAAGEMLEADVAANRRQGSFGVNAIEEDCPGKAQVAVLTHCNTGSLATSGFGTALGVIRALQEQGRLSKCYATETRPYNQGSRLTAYEMVQDGLPGVLITDSMVTALMGSGGVDAVVTGADRVVANGDTANKIGTHQLAVVCKHFGIPFYIVAPATTLDCALSTGEHIKIEERPPNELTTVKGVRLAPEEIAVWNPAFDVTPASLITAIITDKGVIRPSADGSFDVKAFLGAKIEASSLPSGLQTPAGYRMLTVSTVGSYLCGIPSLKTFMGVQNAEQIQAEEVGDGNLNLVFICRSPTAVLVVKQALPYVRCVGESWPLFLDRSHFESMALLEEAKYCPEHTPAVHYSNRVMGTIVMQYIAPPHIILRKGFIQGITYPSLAKHVARFTARTLFCSSGFHLTGPEIRLACSKWNNNFPMCELTEKVIFTDPYTVCDMNRWTTPELDEAAATIRSDTALKMAVSRLKNMFVSRNEALIHGDLHSGSLMCTPDSTFVIDPEFAFYGPMGFDLGAFMGNVFLAFFSQRAHNGEAYADYLLQINADFAREFEAQFLELWDMPNMHKGPSYSKDLYPTLAEKRLAQQTFMGELFKESLGFAGCKMIRRIVGIAHVEDLDSITDQSVRAHCEYLALEFAKRLVLGSTSTVEEAVKEARGLKSKLFGSSLVKF